MGRNPKYTAPYSAGGTADYWEFILGDLHEAWNMNSPGYYPTSQKFSVTYHGARGAWTKNADEVKQEQCDNHHTGGSCAEDVMTPSISENRSDRCVFTNYRMETVI